MKYSFITTKDNSITLYNNFYKDIYHSKAGAIKEALYKFLYPLKDLFKNSYNENLNFLIIDLGFGLGYNRFIFEKYLNKIGIYYNIISLEKDEELLMLIKNNIDKFKIKGYKNFINKIFKKKIRLENIKNLKKELKNNSLFIADAKTFFNKNWIMLSNENSIKILLHDAFSPNKNKELWDWNFFDLISKSKVDIVITYTSNPKVRNTLLIKGYYILETKAFGRRKGGTIAIKKEIINKEIIMKYVKDSLKEGKINLIKEFDYLLMASSYGKPFNYKGKWPSINKNKIIKIWEKYNNYNDYKINNFLKVLSSKKEEKIIEFYNLLKFLLNENKLPFNKY